MKHKVQGIRRMACVVWGQNRPVGVLALALCNVSGLLERIDQYSAVLLREVWNLSAEAKAKLVRSERRCPNQTISEAYDADGATA